MDASTDRAQSGIVFNIQHYSVHDGPGIRTNVFMKGCPLACRWCSNPESQQLRPEIAFKESRCLTLAKCLRCVRACPHGAVLAERECGGALPGINREACRDCSFECAQACPPRSLIVYGQRMSVDEVLAAVEKQEVFYKRSQGGITLSGGEPFFQIDFALALLREAGRRRIRAAAETTGCLSWENLQQAARLLDTVIYDLKHSDPERHKQGTGVDNSLILHNFHKLASGFPNLPILARTPVIPGFNDSREAIAGLIDQLAGHPNVSYELLPYHRLGTQKYLFLGRECAMGEAVLAEDTLADLRQYAASRLGGRAIQPSAGPSAGPGGPAATSSAGNKPAA